MAYRPSDHVQRTSPKGDFRYDLARQDIPADSIIRIHGFNNAVDAAATESINFQGGLYEFLESGELLTISSSDVLDDGVGLKATSSAIFIVNHIEDPIEFAITSSVDARIKFSGSADNVKATSNAVPIFIVNHIEDPIQFSITSSVDARIVFSGSAAPVPPDSASLNLFYFLSGSSLSGSVENLVVAINSVGSASEVSASTQPAANVTSSLLALTASLAGAAFNAIDFLSGSTVFDLAGGTLRPNDSASENIFYFVSASSLQSSVDNLVTSINSATASDVSASTQPAADATSSLLALTASNPGTDENAIRFLSGSTSFALAGGTDPLSGARTLLITGLTGSDYSEISESWDLSGSLVGDSAEQGKNFGDSVLSYIRVNSVKVTAAGNVTGSNFGDISIRSSGSDTFLGIVPSGLNELHNGVYTVPNDQTAILTSWQVSLNTLEVSGSAVVQLKSRESGSLFYVDDSINLQSNGRSSYYKELEVPIRYPERTDIIVQAKSDTDSLRIQTTLTFILREN